MAGEDTPHGEGNKIILGNIYFDQDIITIKVEGTISLLSVATNIDENIC